MKTVFALLALCLVAVHGSNCGPQQNGASFQKERKNMGYSSLYPRKPVCELGEELTIREAFEGGWFCLIENKSKENHYVVRAQATANDNNPKKDFGKDWYYYVPPQAYIKMDGGEAGDNMVCRLCGAKNVNNLVGTSEGNFKLMKNIEVPTANFQCRRRCSATLYEHRNFNGNSLTVSSNLRDLTQSNLVDAKKTTSQGITGAKASASISSLRIDGEDCEVRLYNAVDYANSGTPVCTFTASYDVSSWDMDAVRKECCGAGCPNGQDCVRSVAIRDTKMCGPARSGNVKPAGCPKGKTCVSPGNPSMEEIPDSEAVKAQSLKRLFKAMAEVLED